MEMGGADRKGDLPRESPPFKICLSLPALTLCLVALPILGAASLLAHRSISGGSLSPGMSGAVAILLILIAAASVFGAILLTGPLFRLARSCKRDGGGKLPVVGWRELRVLARSLNEACENCRVESKHRLDSEGRYRVYVESMAEGLVVVDRDQRIVFANPRFAHMLKMDPDAMIGLEVSCIVAPGSRPVLLRETERRRRGLTGKYEMEWERGDGTRIPSSISAAPLRDEEGRIAGAFAVVTDLAERRRMEAQLVAAERLKALGELAGGVGHDFNNRLTTILGNAQLLLLDKHTPEVKRGLEIIERSAMAGGAMVKGLIAFTRQDPTGRREDLEVNTLVRDVLRLTSLRVSEGQRSKKLRARLSLSATKAASAYAGELREALFSVIANAFEAIRSGGEVCLSTYDHSEGVAIRVQDTGEGMDISTRARAFDPFFTTRGPQRTGLGLSIVHGIVRRIGGRLNLKSALGEGTSVELVLPASNVPRPVVRIKPWRLGEAPPKRVALLTSEPDFAQSMRSAFARLQVELTAFRSPDSLLDALVTKRFGILVADPERDGIPTAQTGRRISPDTRMVMITDWPEEEARLLAAESFVDRVVRRPFSIPDLVELLTRELRASDTIPLAGAGRAAAAQAEESPGTAGQGGG